MMLQKFSAKRCAAGGLSLAGALLLSIAGGCQNTTQNQGHPRVVVQGQNETSTSTQPPVDGSRTIKTVISTVPEHDNSPLNAFDPCAEQMEDLIGPLLEYFKKNQHGPANVQELSRFAIPGVPLQTACPVSKKPYLCAPNGLQAPGENIRIYIYDADAVHSGERWCVIDKGAISGAPGLFVEHIPEVKFRKFLASAPVVQPAPAPVPPQQVPQPAPARQPAPSVPQ